MRYLILIILALQGCATSDQFGSRVSAGSAKYSYSRTLADGSVCKVEILSARDVIGGELTISDNCSISSKVNETKGVDAALAAINSALELAKEAASKAP